MVKEFDAIVFGASGFTGQYTVEEVAISMEMNELYKTNNLKWAVAGRNKDKVSKVLQQAEKNTNLAGLASRVPIIEADVNDYQSLVKMASKTRLVINVVGPYRFYGENVVKACIEGRSHLVCISGEPQYLEEMQLKYYESANKAGVYIVGACGFDSIPADLGTTYTKQQFSGDLNSVDVILKIKSEDKTDGPTINYGTWLSAIHSLAHQDELKALRKELFTTVLPYPSMLDESRKQHKKIPFLGQIEEFKRSYIIPFHGSDKAVVKRSEVYKYNKFHERPVHAEVYFTVGSKWVGVTMVFVAAIFSCLTKFKFGRSLLETYPGFFSCGMVARDGVPESSLKGKSCSHTIIGYGWDEKFSDPDKVHAEKPQKKIVTRVHCPLDPGYRGTSAMLVHSGMTLLFDKDLPEPGVLSPGACFRNTYLIDRLSKRNFRFEVVEKY